MIGRKTLTWVATVDGQHAHFYTKGEEHRLGDLNYTLTARPIRTDVPASRHALGRVYDRHGNGRHIIEPHTSDRAQGDKAFVDRVAAYLDKARANGEFTRLIISAPPGIIGLLRDTLSKEVKDTIALELDKDLMQCTPAQIQHYLEKIIYV